MAVSVEPLHSRHLDLLRQLLAREPAHNLYLLGLLEDFGVTARPGRPPFNFYGRFVDDELTAAVFVGGDGALMVPSASPVNAIGDLAKSLAMSFKAASILGDKIAVDVLAQHLCSKKPSLSKTQRLFAVSADDLG